MELHQLFLFLAIILIAARLLSEAVARFGVSSVIGKLLAEVGIILLLFEVAWTQIFRVSHGQAKPYVVALIGFTLPLALGYGVSAWLFNLPKLVALFIGGTLTASLTPWTNVTRTRRRSSSVRRYWTSRIPHSLRRFCSNGATVVNSTRL